MESKEQGSLMQFSSKRAFGLLKIPQRTVELTSVRLMTTYLFNMANDIERVRSKRKLLTTVVK